MTAPFPTSCSRRPSSIRKAGNGRACSGWTCCRNTGATGMPGSSCGRSSIMPAKTGAAAASWHARNIFCIIMPDSASRIWAFPSQNTAGPSGMTWFWSFLLLLYKSIGSVIVCGCFISTAQWEYSFFPVFPLAESMAEAFFWLFLWIFKEKSINHFLWQIQSIFSKGCVQFYGWWFFFNENQ